MVMIVLHVTRGNITIKCVVVVVVFLNVFIYIYITVEPIITFTCAVVIRYTY